MSFCFGSRAVCFPLADEDRVGLAKALRLGKEVDGALSPRMRLEGKGNVAGNCSASDE
jgi:hypothetical protein